MKINVTDKTVQTVALIEYRLAGLFSPKSVNISFAPDNIELVSASPLQIVVRELAS